MTEQKHTPDSMDGADVVIENMRRRLIERSSQVDALREINGVLLVAAKRAVMALAANGAPNCEAAKELRAAIAKAEAT
jgi:hypothetical protein